MARKIKTQNAVCLSLPGRLSRQIACAGSGADNISVRLVEIEPENSLTVQRNKHYHPDVEECIYVLEGAGCTFADSGEYSLAEGDTLVIPPNERHLTRNTGMSVLKLLCFFPTGKVTILGE